MSLSACFSYQNDCMVCVCCIEMGVRLALKRRNVDVCWYCLRVRSTVNAACYTPYRRECEQCVASLPFNWVTSFRRYPIACPIKCFGFSPALRTAWKIFFVRVFVYDWVRFLVFADTTFFVTRGNLHWGMRIWFSSFLTFSCISIFHVSRMQKKM